MPLTLCDAVILVYAYRCFGGTYCLGLHDFFWDITPYSLVYAYRRFGGTYCLGILGVFWDITPYNLVYAYRSFGRTYCLDILVSSEIYIYKYIIYII
jgi:hypothetical protein